MAPPTPLTLETGRPAKPPFPVRQLAVILLVMLCEPITASIIFPFVAKLVTEVRGGETRRVGYWVGIIESLFFLAQALSVLQWGRLSDRIGRKPVLLTGMLGLSISICSFGLSRSFWGLVISRSVAGFLNGNVGVIKTMMAELTEGEEEWRARAFSFFPVTWISGSTIAPLIGGFLQHPAERFPNVFGNSKFLKKYPYFLPCATAASYSICAFTFALTFLRETLQSKVSPVDASREGYVPIPLDSPISRHHPRTSTSDDQSYSFGPDNDLNDENAPQGDDSPEIIDAKEPEPILSLRSVLIPRVIIAIANYGALALLEIAFFALLTVFLAIPIDEGGLGLAPPTIGTILASFGIISGIFQLIAFPRLRKIYGDKNLYMTSILSFFIMYPAYIGMHMIAVRATSDSAWIWVWAVLGIQMAGCTLLDMGYSTIFLFVTSSAPSPAALGTVNGLAQTLISCIRALGPAGATALHSLSVENSFGGRYGYGIFMVGVVLACGAMVLATLLPAPEQQKLNGGDEEHDQ